MDKLACGKLLDAIYHRTDYVAKVDLLSSRKSFLKSANTYEITKRLSILLAGYDIELA